MITSKVIYNGELRTEAVHVKSGTTIITDAPTDNHGKGEAFSPTDLVATALASCMISIMGIVAMKEGFKPVDGATAEITKVMYSDPRRIGEVHVTLNMPKLDYSEKERKMYENAAYTCPVAKSLHPDIKQIIKINW